MLWSWLFVITLITQHGWSSAVTNKKFPKNFMFGCATASYQVEGAWDEDGKSPNIWDVQTHEKPWTIKENHTGDVACDSYHKYEEDVKILKELGVHHYRFSISWARILPDPSHKVNQKGIEYYNKLIDELLKNDIIPLVTIYHWDLPQYLQDIGGWANPRIVGFFESYARVLFENFGDKVQWWLTFNEPMSICQQGYGDVQKAPMVDESGIADYLCTHHLLLSHARAWRVYDEEYREKQKGKVGITLNTEHYEPKDPDSDDDKEAANLSYQFNFGWFAHPIFSAEGNYPPVMIERVAERSEKEGFSVSRLPEFTEEQIKQVQGTYDFLGLNHYSTRLTTKLDAPIGEPNWVSDMGSEQTIDPNWPTSASDWLQVVPEGMKKLLIWLTENYPGVEIIITENGFTDTGGTEDPVRINYYKQYLSNLLEAVLENDAKVFGYTAWSCIDNFEWISGYTEKFGLYSVDFDDENRPRTAKLSATYYKNVIESRCLLEEGEGECEDDGDGGDGDGGEGDGGEGDGDDGDDGSGDGDGGDGDGDGGEGDGGEGDGGEGDGGDGDGGEGDGGEGDGGDGDGGSGDGDGGDGDGDGGEGDGGEGDGDDGDGGSGDGDGGDGDGGEGEGDGGDGDGDGGEGDGGEGDGGEGDGGEGDGGNGDGGSGDGDGGEGDGDGGEGDGGEGDGGSGDGGDGDGGSGDGDGGEGDGGEGDGDGGDGDSGSGGGGAGDGGEGDGVESNGDGSGNVGGDGTGNESSESNKDNSRLRKGKINVIPVLFK